MKSERSNKTLTMLLIAVATFCLAAGVVEVWMDSVGHTQVMDERGDYHPITWSQIAGRSLLIPLICLPHAIIGNGLLYGVAWTCSHLLSGYPKALAAVVGLFIGAASGSMLSYTVYAMIGGWGPPLLIPATCAGSVLFAGLAISVPRPGI